MWLTREERIRFAVVLSPALLGIAVAFRPRVSDPWDGRPEFDQVVWRKGEDAGYGARATQADRLIDRRTLIGKSRAEVVELLGEPTPEPGDDTALRYPLGPGGFFDAENDWLIVTLGADGRVKHCFRRLRND